MHDTSSLQRVDFCLETVRPQMDTLLSQVLDPHESASAPGQKRGRGRPCTLLAPHLWLGLLHCVLHGMQNYQDLWRWLSSTIIACFAPVSLTDDAIVKRLRQAGLEPLQQLLTLFSQVLAQRLAPLVATALAAFATKIVAIDESTADAVSRLLEHQRKLPKGDLSLVPGKIAARFTIRSQQWDLVQWRHQVSQNCKVELLSLLEGLEQGSLVLFDLGYFSFPWFDYLSEQRYWYVSRLREKTTYQIIHTFYRHHEILDALVWLGSSHGSRAGQAVRLVRFGDGTSIRMYLTMCSIPASYRCPILPACTRAGGISSWRS